MLAKRSSGLSLIELLVAMSVIAILATAGQAFAVSLVDVRRVSGAADAIRSQLQLARSEAIKQMRIMTITYSMADTSDWRMGTRDGDAECDTALSDPAQADSCSIPQGADRVLTVLTSAQFPGVAAHANRSATRFNPLRGTSAGSNLTIRLTSAGGKEVRVIVSNLGRVRTCSPLGAAKVGGYVAC